MTACACNFQMLPVCWPGMYCNEAAQKAESRTVQVGMVAPWVESHRMFCVFADNACYPNNPCNSGTPCQSNPGDCQIEGSPPWGAICTYNPLGAGTACTDGAITGTCDGQGACVVSGQGGVCAGRGPSRLTAQALPVTQHAAFTEGGGSNAEFGHNPAAAAALCTAPAGPGGQVHLLQPLRLPPDWL